MDVYFDTEFTNLDQKEYQGLISVGLVAADGREFYAELSDTYHHGLCSQFVVDTVLPLLEGGSRDCGSSGVNRAGSGTGYAGNCKMTEAQLAVRLKEWIESLGEEEVVLRSDCPRVDWHWLEQIFTFYGRWPLNLKRKCGGIFFEEDRERHRFGMALADYWKTQKRRHHALVDARSLQFAVKFAMRKGNV